MKTITVTDAEEFMLVEGLYAKAKICNDAGKGLGGTVAGSALRAAQNALQESAEQYEALAKKVLDGKTERID